MSGFRIRMQTLVLAVLIPALLIVTVVTGFLIYQDVHSVILSGFDKKLFAVSSTTASFIDGDVHQAILKQTPSEDSPMYLQYVAPMRRILHKADCKYVYTQVVGPTSDPTKDITYILDATVGPDHSHIGDLDVLPAEEEVGCHQVQAGKRPYYITTMHPWTEWGLLKSCFTAIYDHTGHVQSMAGTDVDVSIVVNKTSNLLFEVGAVSLVCILFGTILSIQVARRLTRPIALVKEGALIVAAGQYGHKIEIDRPQELADLAASFNQLSAALGGTIADLTNANREVEQKRRVENLSRLLAGSMGAKGGDRLAAGRIGNKGTVNSSSGYAFSPDGRLAAFWAAEPGNDPLDDARLRAEISEMAERLLGSAEGTDEAGEIARRLTSLFPAITGFALLDGQTATVRSNGRGTISAVLFDDGQSTSIDLASRPETRLSSGQSLVIGTGGAASLAGPPNAGATAMKMLADIEGAAQTRESEEIVIVLVAP